MFRLTKWYLDLHTDEGVAFIGYALRLRWTGLSIHYASTLLSAPGQPVRERYTLRHARLPDVASGDVVSWTCAALGVHGEWSRRFPPHRACLYRDEAGAGRLSWECIAPAAAVRLRLAENELVGTGYVERLRLSVPPWRLPLHELHWGRFIGARSSVVWIDWRGAAPRRVVLVNGADRSDGARVHEQWVRAPGLALALDTGTARSLRRGPLADVMAAVPGLPRLVPERLARAEESKWITRASLEAGESTPADTGWAIHEVVKWPTHAQV